MGSVSTAFRAFFATLFNRQVALRVNRALNDQPATVPAVDVTRSPKLAEPVRSVPPKPIQSEAITLLATLQREARLIDFLQEDLSSYSDEQVGAAVREIHRDSGSVLNRVFAIRPIVTDEEGATVEVPAGFDAARFRLTGKLTGDAPFRGVLRHHGWEATQCELPVFTGSESAAKAIAAAEIELP